MCRYRSLIKLLYAFTSAYPMILIIPQISKQWSYLLSYCCQLIINYIKNHTLIYIDFRFLIVCIIKRSSTYSNFTIFIDSIISSYEISLLRRQSSQHPRIFPHVLVHEMLSRNKTISNFVLLICFWDGGVPIRAENIIMRGDQQQPFNS